MKDLMINGGPGMWLILLFGVLSLATAGWFAWRAEGRVRGFLDAMGRAVKAAALAATSLDLLVVCSRVADERPDLRWVLMLKGVSESLSPLVLGFAFLALIHFFTAIGQRRVDGKNAQ